MKTEELYLYTQKCAPAQWRRGRDEIFAKLRGTIIVCQVIKMS